MAGKAVMHAVQYDSYGGGVAGLKVVYLQFLISLTGTDYCIFLIIYACLAKFLWSLNSEF